MGSYISIVNDTHYPSTTIILKDIFGLTELSAQMIRPHLSIRNVNKLALKISQDLHCGLESRYGRIEKKVTVYSSGEDGGVSTYNLSSFFEAELAWWHVLEGDDTYEEYPRLLRKLNRFLAFIDENRNWLDNFIQTVSKQGKIVTGVKAGLTTTGVVGTVMMFTPLFPVGAIITGASAVASLANSAGDAIADSIRKGQFEEKFKELIKLKENYYLALYDLEPVERELRREYGLEDATGLALQLYYHAATVGGHVTNLAAQLATYGPIIKEAVKFIKAGSTTQNAFKVAVQTSTVLATGRRATVIGIGTAEGLYTVERVAGGLMKAGKLVKGIAVLGAAIDVIDLIHTGLSTKDNVKVSTALRDELDNLLPQERERQAELRRIINGN